MNLRLMYDQLSAADKSRFWQLNQEFLGEQLAAVKRRKETMTAKQEIEQGEAHELCSSQTEH